MIIPGNGEIASTEGTAQGDPPAMTMYALTIIPLTHLLRSCVQQVWFSNDATGASTSKFPSYNASKTYLIVKQEHMTNAQERFADTDVHITIQGRRHLSAAIGSRTFTCSKVQTWPDEIKRLA